MSVVAIDGTVLAAKTLPFPALDIKILARKSGVDTCLSFSAKISVDGFGQTPQEGEDVIHLNIPLWTAQAKHDYPMAMMQSSLPDGRCTSPDEVRVSVAPVDGPANVCTCQLRWPS